MNPSQQLAALALTLAAFLASHSAWAGTWRAPEVVSAAGAPFKLRQAGPPPCLDSPVEGDGLSIAYLLENTSAEELTEVAIEIVDLSAAGEAKGSVTYRRRAEIAPGEWISNTYTLASFHVSPGDRLIILPSGARGRTLRWQVSAAEVRDLREALREEKNDMPPAPGCFNPALCKGCGCGVAGSSCESDSKGALVTVYCDCKSCPEH